MIDDDTLRKGRRRSRRVKLILLITASLVIGAMGSATIHAHASNTLHANGRWRSCKIDLALSPIGSVTSFFSRVALSGNCLNLGAWFGHQGMVYDRDLEVLELSFEFQIPDGSYLSCEFNGTAYREENESFLGLRISRNSLFPSQFYRRDYAGIFQEAAPIECPQFDSGWQRASIIFEPSGYQLEINGTLVERRATPTPTAQRIAFRAGANPARVDAVKIVTPTEIITDSFDRWGHVPSLIGLWASVIAGLDSIVLLLLLIRNAQRPLLSVFACNFVLASGVWLGWALDHYYVSGLYPKDLLSNPAYAGRLIVPEPAHQTSPPLEATAKPFRIVFVGSSQTVGMGAARHADTWVNRLKRILNSEPTSQRDYDCISCAVSGGKSPELLEKFQHEYLTGENPDLVVINLSHNDPNVIALGYSLKEFAAICRKHEIPLVMILEPDTSEDMGVRTKRNHIIVRFVGEVEQVPVIDMQEAMDSVIDKGFLWWDQVHMSSAGQKLFAELLHDRLLHYLPG